MPDFCHVCEAQLVEGMCPARSRHTAIYRGWFLDFIVTILVAMPLFLL